MFVTRPDSLAAYQHLNTAFVVLSWTHGTSVSFCLFFLMHIIFVFRKPGRGAGDACFMKNKLPCVRSDAY